MGTSNSYGGSNKQAWRSARQQILDLPSGGGGDGAGGESDDSDPLGELWGTIGDALDSDDPTLHEPILDQSEVSLPRLMPWLAGGGGGGTGGGTGGGAAGGGQGSRSGGGRQGRGSKRQVTKSAARGGAVLGAAHAVRRGDAQYLHELGLDLGHLQTLSPRQQAAEILDSVLGEGAHPDEAALRRASLESLKEVLAAPTEPDPLDSVRSFVSNFVFEQSLVELQRQMKEAELTTEAAADQEQKVRAYLAARTKRIKMPASGSLQPRDLTNESARLTKEVIKLLRSRKGAAE